MAEETKNSSSKMATLWPSLKKKLVEAKKKKKQKKSNPFASQGLEKFALLMAELQAKKSSLVDKTGNSVSAVRYLSRSAQEWTASTIARTASRGGRRDSSAGSPKGQDSSSSEILLLQQQQLPSDYGSISKAETITTTTTEPEIVEFSHSFSFPEPSRGYPEAFHSGHGFESEVLHRHGFDSEVLVVGDLQRETDAVETTTRESACEEEESEVGCSGKKMDMIRTGRLLLLEKGWARSSPNSAVALVVALSACVLARVSKIGNSFLEFLTIDLVFRWQKGKLYADFLQSLVTRHIVPHLSVPRGLALLPLVNRRNKSSSKTPELLAVHRTPEAEIEQEKPLDLSFSFPVVAPEEIVSAEIRTNDLAPVKIRTASSTRRLVRKISSKLKSKMGSPDSSHSSLSPRKSSKFSFSRKEKSEASSDDGWPDDEVFADSASSSKKRCILGKKCSFRKEKTPELPSTLRRSPLGRNFSIESNTDMIITSVTPPVFDTGFRKNFDLWLILGLLVALLFLLVSRLSAIVATSLLFLLLSHAHKEPSKYRMPPRRSTREPEPSSNEFYRRGH